MYLSISSLFFNTVDYERWLDIISKRKFNFQLLFYSDFFFKKVSKKDKIINAGIMMETTDSVYIPKTRDKVIPKWVDFSAS